MYVYREEKVQKLLQFLLNLQEKPEPMVVCRLHLSGNEGEWRVSFRDVEEE
jgi:hypothetical protein